MVLEQSKKESMSFYFSRAHPEHLLEIRLTVGREKVLEEKTFVSPLRKVS